MSVHVIQGNKGDFSARIRTLLDRPYAVAAIWFLVLLVPTTLNVFSVLTEADRMGRNLSTWEPFVWEYSSLLAGLCALPVVLVYLKSVRGCTGWRLPASHLIGSLLFSAVHVCLMVAARGAVYDAMGRKYSFGVLSRELPYEYRKDLLAYALIIAIAAVVAWARRPVPDQTPSRTSEAELVSLRSGSRTVVVPVSEVVLLKAAGNYSEVITRERQLLVRRPLSALLDHEFGASSLIRVHRSCAVNPDAIRRVDPTPAGDLRLLLDTGEEIACSRRYKEALPPFLHRISTAPPLVT